ncbi:MAG: hypothetical protein ACRERD_03960 [Candidatus Binatia bacterium]
MHSASWSPAGKYLALRPAARELEADLNNAYAHFLCRQGRAQDAAGFAYDEFMEDNPPMAHVSIDDIQ